MVWANTCTQSLLWIVILIGRTSVLLLGDASVIGGLSLHGAKVLDVSSVNSDAIRHIDVLSFRQALIVETSRPEEFLWSRWLFLRVSCWRWIKHQISEHWEHLGPRRVLQRMKLHVHGVVHFSIYTAVWHFLLVVLVDDRGTAFMSVCWISYIPCICW